MKIAQYSFFNQIFYLPIVPYMNFDINCKVVPPDKVGRKIFDDTSTLFFYFNKI